VAGRQREEQPERRDPGAYRVRRHPDHGGRLARSSAPVIAGLVLMAPHVALDVASVASLLLTTEAVISHLS